MSSLSRPSLAPGRNAPIVKDKRPIGDKGFQAKCVREIISFLPGIHEHALYWADAQGKGYKVCNQCNNKVPFDTFLTLYIVNKTLFDAIQCHQDTF